MFDMRRREFITLLAGALSVSLCKSGAAQEGYSGAGHDQWHQGFYSKLNRNDGKGFCCNLMDCRPTQSRMVGTITKSRQVRRPSGQGTGRDGKVTAMPWSVRFPARRARVPRWHS